MEMDVLQKSFETLADHLSPFQSLIAGNFAFIPALDNHGDLWFITPATIQSAYNVGADEWYCLTSADHQLPHGDVILGILLHIQHDVDEFYSKAFKLTGRPDAIMALYEVIYRSMPEDEKREDDCFPNDQCPDCVWSGYLTQWCDYHRGLMHGITVGYNLGRHLHSPKDDKWLQSPLSRYLDSIATGLNEVKYMVKRKKNNDDLIEVLRMDEQGQHKFNRSMHETMRTMELLKKAGLNPEIKELDDVTDNDYVVTP